MLVKEPFDRLDNAAYHFEELAQQIEVALGSVDQSNHIEVINAFDRLRKAHAKFDESKKILNKLYDRLNIHWVPDAMRLVGVKTTTVEGVGRVTVSHRFSCSILGDDKEPGYNWLRENAAGDLIKPTVNSSALAGFAKNRIVEEGLDMPEGIFKVGTSPYVSITKVQ